MGNAIRSIRKCDLEPDLPSARGISRSRKPVKVSTGNPRSKTELT
jgi:hypothetical protein